MPRIADANSIPARHLLAGNLGPASIDLDSLAMLDVDPPPIMLTMLSERTGVPLDLLRQMTFAGWVPWLFDTLEPDPAAFDTYVRGDSVLLADGEAPRRELERWRAWLGPEQMRRACPDCHTNPGGGLTLVSQIPLTLTCLIHQCELEPVFGPHGSVTGFERDDSDPIKGPVVVAMDARTHEGLATGRVSLPRRQVHVGVWLRMLRTLLEELHAPISKIRPRSHHAIDLIWATAGYPRRAGGGRWKPFESLTWDRQRKTLHAAAIAIDLIETERITAYGTRGRLLLPEPEVHLDPGQRPTVNHWQRAQEALEEAVALAKASPQDAHQLMISLGYFCTRGELFDRLRDGLIDMGVPGSFLPTWQELHSPGDSDHPALPVGDPTGWTFRPRSDVR